MRPLVALSAVFAVFISDAQAQAPASQMIKRSNPNELAFVVFVDDDCGVTEAAATEVVTGVLTRSRIKAVPFAASPDWFGMQVSVDCMPSKTAFNIQVDFFDKPSGEFIRVGLDGYGGFGVFDADQAYLLNAMKGHVERAVTDYLKANFDL